MVYHVVMWNFKEEVEDAKRKDLQTEMAKQLEGLVGKVPGLLTAKFVATPLPTSTHDMALVTTLEKAEDIKIYGSHPEHVAVADTYVRPYVCNRACLDFEM